MMYEQPSQSKRRNDAHLYDLAYQVVRTLPVYYELEQNIYFLRSNHAVIVPLNTSLCFHFWAPLIIDSRNVGICYRGFLDIHPHFPFSFSQMWGCACRRRDAPSIPGSCPARLGWPPTLVRGSCPGRRQPLSNSASARRPE